MKMTIDFSNAKEQGNFLPAGKHTVKIKNIEAKETKNGHPQLIITFVDANGREFTHYQLADFEQDWVKNWFYNFTKNAGLPVKKENFTFDTNDLVGKPIFVDIQREYNDYSEKYKNKLKYTAKYDKGKADQWDEEYAISDEEKALKAKQGGATSSSNNSNPFANADGPIDITDEDLPF
ncbi:DUF669 domain-containing protein [Mammaliicoccus vitulinus]|uniref:DUF669 domain-containing protein n=1 Tax=Mammaliicoccus vitulinus TaxID=71237 RepID=UPI001AAD4A93|nr:DUF669 domain-containing protein [Mammaliicoccus vitulinus]MBO3076715.1 DUF669 domain-containing protein [Mammaliicoccus vitulinus]